MLTLSLLRHAKSSWDDPGLDDYERPLAKRGVKAMPLVAEHVRRESLVPQLVLCSTAVRTRATCALLLTELAPPLPEVRYDEALYLASAATILSRLQGVEAQYSNVMVIAHNPGLHALALELIGDGGRKSLGAIATEFPTAALAVLTFDSPSWSEVKGASGRLAHFATPRRLGQ